MQKGGNLKQRGRELAPIRNEAYKIYLANLDIKGRELQKLLLDKGHEVHVGTVSSWLNRFRKGKKAKKRKEPAAVEVKVPVRLTTADIAAALLKGVVEALNNHDKLLDEVLELKGWKQRAVELQVELTREKGERERILKLHNDQVKSGQLTSVKELVRLAER